MDADAGAEYLASIFGTEKDKWVLCAVYQRLFVHLKFGKNDFIEAEREQNLCQKKMWHSLKRIS